MDLSQKKAVVRQFLEHCNRYADDKLRSYAIELADCAAERQLAIADKIVHWSAYRSFNLHALEELESDRLDDWLDDEAAGSETRGRGP
jgi:hypothetical protein